jgi:acyl-CoA synthetase (AMP-forming)/AMP-acid ligase II
MSTVAGVPTQLALMLRDPDFDPSISPRCYTSSRAAGRSRLTSPRSTRAIRREARDAILVHGSRHRSRTAFDDPEEDAIVSVGVPHASVELALRDDDDATSAPVPSARSACALAAVMSGYWPRPNRPRRVHRRRFVRTGDLGWVDDRGRLRLVGRSKEMYVRGGYNVYPGRGRGVLSTHADVAAVAIVPASTT